MNSLSDHPTLDAICNVLHSPDAKYRETRFVHPFDWKMFFTLVGISMIVGLVIQLYTCFFVWIIGKVFPKTVSRVRYLWALAIMMVAMFGVCGVLFLIFKLDKELEVFGLLFSMLLFVILVHLLGVGYRMKWSSSLSVGSFVSFKQIGIIAIVCSIICFIIIVSSPQNPSDPCDFSFFFFTFLYFIETSVFLFGGVYLLIALVWSCKAEKFQLISKMEVAGVLTKKVDNVWVENWDVANKRIIKFILPSV